MKISLNWLKELVEFDCSVEELAAILTMRGLEVEHIARLGEKYKNFVVGEIFEMNNHPNAEKLSLCTVDIGKGKEKLKIVCGAPNAQEGQYVVVALVGAVIPVISTIQTRTFCTYEIQNSWRRFKRNVMFKI